MFTFTSTPIPGAFLIEPTVFGDSRGYCIETYNQHDFANAGIDRAFVRNSQRLSRRGTLRGLRGQRRFPQALLARALHGTVFYVCVDVRPDSAAYGQWYGVLLSGEIHRQFYLPRGTLHGFLTLSDSAALCCQCDEFRRPEDEYGLRWDDPHVGVAWPLSGLAAPPFVSAKDGAWGGWAELQRGESAAGVRVPPGL
jgi:dTDP-4-dehydrorhamnose 3,5-epimerase